MKSDRSKYHRVLPPMTRRRFVRDLGLTAGAAAGFVALGLASFSREPVRRVEEPALRLRDFRAWAALAQSPGAAPD